MNAFDPRIDARLSLGYGGRFYGVYTAIVVDVVDPDGQGRVKIRLPWSPDVEGAGYEVWARLATMMGGANRGTWFVPDVDDEVLVNFEAGDPRRPYVLGGLWNGQDNPPESMDSSGENNIKTIRSRSGVVITIDDTGGQEKLTLQTPGGQEVVLQDSDAGIELRDSNENVVRLNSSGVSISSSGTVSIQAGTLEVTAGSVSVTAGMSRFSGAVQGDSVISNSVVGASYTTGAGNIW